MKPTSLLKHYAGTPIEELPPEIAEQVKSDSALLAEMEQQAEMASLMGLKRYETPDEAVFGRVQYRTMLQIKNQASARPEPFFFQLPGWARVTAVLAFMLGLSVLTHREMLRTEEEEALASAPVEPVVEPTFPVFIRGSDPFAPYTLETPLFESDVFSSALTQQLESDFEALGLTETNRVESTFSLPVVFPAP